MIHRTLSRSLPILALLSLTAGPAPGQAAEPDLLYVRGPVALEVTRALDLAVRKLRTPTCQELLTDFTDSEGRTLLENLGSRSPDQYLTQMTIRDGEIPKGSRRCAVPRAAAFTTGGAAVFVCGGNFHSQDPHRRANALIHEMLHTLGLRENPPTAAEITAQVELRCGT